VIALGTSIADSFDLSKLRYHKIVIMTDADVDGAHIRILLLTLFFRHFPQIISDGYLFIAQPPLYRIQKGKEVHYAYNDEEKEKVLKEFSASVSAKGKGVMIPKKEEEKAEEGEKEEGGEDGGQIKGVNIQRYKGLGEMNPDQLWETTMNPEQRIMKKVIVEDAEEADKMFDILMGDEVGPRKRFIETHALDVKNLDV